MTGGCTTTALAYGGKGANTALCHGATGVHNSILPFTGIDLFWVLMLGFVFIAIGLAGMRAGRRG